ncbi:MAG TPA: hypothetical protein VMA09_18955 [Candidatus Binataceae bacterium]|nr:hypothetical protein [Candidatus Binataceae bacterium]
MSRSGRILCQSAALMLAIAFASGCALSCENGTTCIGGPASIDGPLMVHGPLSVGGPLTVHGPVLARKIAVGGPLETTMPRGETPGQAGQMVPNAMAVGGPLTVNGMLAVDGTLRVGGPLHCEAATETQQALDFSQPPPPTDQSAVTE